MTQQIVAEFADITYTMWQLGWDERNGGNISAILDDSELVEFELNYNATIKNMKDIPINLIGKKLLITASGSQFRLVRQQIKQTLGIIELMSEGYRVLWGFENDNQPTSELYMHLLAHSARLEIDPTHRVVLHNHATEVSALSFILPQTDLAFTQTLWRMITECLIVFPDGIGVLPWMVCGTKEIGEATAAKLTRCRIVVWAYHGILATGNSIEDCFGLIETVNKAAKVYLSTAHLNPKQGINNQELAKLAQYFQVEPRKEFLI